MKRSDLTIVVQNASSCSSVPVSRQVRSWVRAALRGLAHGELTVRIVGESEGAELNSRYRRGTGPTNVLAFPGEADPGVLGDELPQLGDLVVCAPVLEREAQAQCKPLDAHWAHILIHGALHLIGYDHQTPADAKTMEARERELLAELGYADPYTAPVLTCK